MQFVHGFYCLLTEQLDTVEYVNIQHGHRSDYAAFAGQSESMVNVLKVCTPKFLIKWHMQTLQTQIRVSSVSTLFAFPLCILRNNYTKNTI